MASLSAPAATTPASDQSATGGLSTSQLVTVSIAGFAFVVGAVFAAIMIYRRKRRKHADVEAPKEFPALRATENAPPGEPEPQMDVQNRGNTMFGAISSKLRTWSKPRSLQSAANPDVGSTSSSSVCPSRGQISAHQDQSALSIVQSKFGQLRTASDQDIQTPEAVRLQTYPAFVGNSIMLDPAGSETAQQQQSPQVQQQGYTAVSPGPWGADADQNSKSVPDAVIGPSPAEISIPPEVHAMQNMRQDRLSLYFGHPFPSYAAPSASPNRGSPNLPSTANPDVNASYIDDDTSTSIDTTLSDDEGREERQDAPQRVPTPVKVGFPPEASSAERVGSVSLLTQRASTSSAPSLSPRLGGYMQPAGLAVQPRLPSPVPPGQELAPSTLNADGSEETVAKRPTIPNWDYHFF
jgi:hypothetical protein